MRTQEPQDPDGSSGIFVTAAAIFGLYAALYFLVARPVMRASFTPSGVIVGCVPYYHGLPAALFAPLNQIDRAVLRPQMWNRGRVWSIPQGNGPITNRASARVEFH